MDLLLYTKPIFKQIFNLLLNQFLMGPQGLIKIPQGPRGFKKNNGGKVLKIQFFGPEVATIFEICVDALICVLLCPRTVQPLLSVMW